MKSALSTFLASSLLLALTMSVGLAHTTATTSPKSGSVLSASPTSIEIKFEHEASLTSVAVIAAGKPDRKLDYAPKGSAKSFTISNANLVTGRNEIQWKALSKDGHVVSGSIVLVVDPAVQKTP